MLVLFIAPMTLINVGLASNVLLLFTYYVVSGIGMVGIGMGIMHDANHGTYSRNKNVNKVLGITLNLVGSNAKIWKIQHNVLHHTYTNIDGADDDIDVPFFLRVSPHSKKYWIHNFQQYYFWFFYGLITISWITIKDFQSLSKYKKMGLLGHDIKYSKEVVKIAVWKLIYFSYVLALPIILLPIPVWIILLAFLSMHFVAGLFISLVFQSAHIVPETKFPQPNNDGQLNEEWTVHQLATTSNFSPKSKALTWMIGGLNYQVEHHLFPNICHVHYPNLAKIVKSTSKEFNIQYHCQTTFWAAIKSHVRLLKKLGRAPQQISVPSGAYKNMKLATIATPVSGLEKTYK